MASGSRNNSSSTISKRDPYSVLNQSRSATAVEIQRAYKRGSRALHPDKQRASFVGAASNDAFVALSDSDAREAFVILKDSYDILLDPCLRQAYDTYGYNGVEFLRKSLERDNKDKLSLYQILSSLHSEGKAQDALQVLQEAMEYHQYQQYIKRYPSHASIEIGCSTNIDDNNSYYLLDPRKIAMGFETTIASSSQNQHQQQTQNSSTSGTNGRNRWNVVLAANTAVANGEASSHRAVRLDCYEVQPGTDVAIELGNTDRTNTLALASTRVLSTGTSVKVGMKIDGTSNNPLALSLSTQRLLWNDSVSSALSLGMGMPNRDLHYISCSFTTLKWPASAVQLRAFCNLGLGQYPLKLTLEQHCNDKSKKSNNSKTNSASIGLNPITGHWELKLKSIRKVSKYINFGIGISDVSMYGLSLLLLLDRGENMSIKIPISITKNRTCDYYYYCAPFPFKIVCIGITSFLIDAAVGCIMGNTTSTYNTGDILQRTKSSSNTESTLFNMNNRRQQPRKVLLLVEERSQLFFQKDCKLRKESEQQLQLMVKTAAKKKCLEESKNGLVIVTATYYTETAHSLDVTSQLQFWVTESKLILPGGCSKAKLIGFYDLVVQVISISSTSLQQRLKSLFSVKRFISFLCFWQKQPQQQVLHQHDNRSVAVKLYVRYKFGSSLYEITVNDKDCLILPNEHALRIGDCRTVQ